MESAFCTDYPACSSSRSMFTRASCSGVMLLQRTTPCRRPYISHWQKKSSLCQESATIVLTGSANHAGITARVAANSSKSLDESLFSIAPRFSSTSSGPSQARARTASPAGRCGATSCHRGAWRSSTIGPPSLSLRLGPDVRGTCRTGTCLVSPRAFAAIPPQGTIVSPQSADRDASTLSMEGGRGPNRVSMGRTYTPWQTRMSSPLRARRDSIVTDHMQGGNVRAKSAEWSRDLGYHAELRRCYGPSQST